MKSNIIKKEVNDMKDGIHRIKTEYRHDGVYIEKRYNNKGLYKTITIGPKSEFKHAEYNQSGFWYRFDYDENGKEIHYTESTGYEFWKTYDENRKYIHFKSINNSTVFEMDIV